MAEIKSSESRGKVVYNESIVNGIVEIAVSNVEGVAKKQSKNNNLLRDNIKIVTDKDGISVSVTVKVLYGYNVPDVAYNIQSGVKESVESMSKYKIAKVDVFVSDVVFEDKPQQQQEDW